MMLPSWSVSGAALMLIGTLSPRLLTMVIERLAAGVPLYRLSAMAQLRPQMDEWNTSEQDWPMASSRDQPVISSAARLKLVMRQWRSTVNTPSAMESRMRLSRMDEVLSRKVSMPPMMLPKSSNSGDELTVTGMELPALPLMKMARSTNRLFWSMAICNRQFLPQTLE